MVFTLISAALMPGAATVCRADDSLRCPSTGRTIKVGDTPVKVQKKCGSPKRREDIIADSCTDDGRCFTGKIGERWVYDFGRSYFVRYVIFMDNHVSQIADGEYGSEPDPRFPAEPAR